MVPIVDARAERAIVEWLRELDSSKSGDPPPSPAAWADDLAQAS
jgi:hypothetical protein